jgi:hypothetical protein
MMGTKSVQKFLYSVCCGQCSETSLPVPSVGSGDAAAASDPAPTAPPAKQVHTLQRHVFAHCSAYHHRQPIIGPTAGA